MLGNFVSISVTMKSLPFSYNRDMQEDKKPLFDSVDALNSLTNMSHIIKKVNSIKNMENATKGNILATIADLLSVNGETFREAHIKVYELTNSLKKQGRVISDLTSDELKDLELIQILRLILNRVLLLEILRVEHPKAGKKRNTNCQKNLNI